MAVKKSVKSVAVTSPITIVLQWLTYALWGWTIVAIAYLAAVIVSYVTGGMWITDSVEPIAYGIAATAILLPFSVICDWLYSKRENRDKKGIASVVMILHVVLFALLALGALVSVAFSGVALLLSNGDTSGSMTAIVVSAILVILYAKLIVRTVRPLLFKKFRLLFRIAISIVALVALVWGAAGPVSEAVITKDDRAVRDGLTSINYAVNQYASTSYKLPGSLQDVTKDISLLNSYYSPLSSDTLKSLVDRGLISYTPNTKPPVKDTTNAPTDGGSSTNVYYELCGVFTHDLKARSWYNAYGFTYDAEGYTQNIEESAIAKGTKCYKLTTSYYKED